MEFLTILLILVSMYLGWNIGANDAANCMGTSVGAGIISVRRAAIVVAIFTFVGASTSGGATIKTVGKGVIDPAAVGLLSIVLALLAASLLVTYFTRKGLPISTTQVVIGAIAGAGIANSVAINWAVIQKMFIYWVLAPIVAAILSYIAYKFISNITRKNYFIETKVYILVIGSGIYLAYTLGANNIGNAMGMAVSSNVLYPMLAGILGGLGMAIGAGTFSQNVMRTIGSGITTLDVNMAFAAQMGSAITVQFLTIMGIPVSITNAIIGGVAGVGLTKGMATIDKTEIVKILRGWVITPVIGALMSIIIIRIANAII